MVAHSQPNGYNSHIRPLRSGQVVSGGRDTVRRAMANDKSDDERWWVWIEQTNQMWKVEFEIWVGLFGFLSIAVTFVGVFVRMFVSFPLWWIVGGMWSTYVVGNLFARFLMYHRIKCPSCGYNPTRRKKDGKPISSKMFNSKVGALRFCPRCGHGTDVHADQGASSGRP